MGNEAWHNQGLKPWILNPLFGQTGFLHIKGFHGLPEGCGGFKDVVLAPNGWNRSFLNWPYDLYNVINVMIITIIKNSIGGK
ncbi:MAG: hypothetical protein Q8P05_01710 [Candidatus Diapherotrites archaeon]|nr:hypothetical protein [Candidatus Diapherotrites archaeon]MDZ4256274.1 hypothetical protein [archaeon]